MGWTKRDLVTQAYEELALAGYVYDLTPEELASALRRLDAMLATWAGLGVKLPYAQSLSPDEGDLDQDSGLPAVAVEAVFLNLAVRIAASKGKQLAVTTSRTAKQAYDALISLQASADAQQQQMPAGTPVGAGRKPWRGRISPYLPSPNTSPLQGDGGTLDFSGKGT